MSLDDRLITVAIHTCEHAIALKEKLESAGLFVTLQNINLEHPVVASGMRVRIREHDLPKALLIIENDESTPHPVESCTSSQEILVPVDFSAYSFEACLVAHHIAAAHDAAVTILYSYYTPLHATSTQLSDALTYDQPVPDSSEEAVEMARRQLLQLRKSIDRKLPATISGKVKTNVVIARGVPEDAINQYSKEHSPLLIVMGTRGTNKKERDLVGSVTAEVLDTCRRPVLTIPEGFTASDIVDIGNVLYFCNGEQSDILAMQRLHELIGEQFRHVTLAHFEWKRSNINSETLRALCNYCTDHFPGSAFSAAEVPVKTSEDICSRIESDDRIGLIALPSKRKSAFARLFNPGMAHRLLFKADIPMIVIPV